MAERLSLEPFDILVAGNEHAVRDGLGQMLAHLAPLALNADETGAVEIVLAEALNNIVKHSLGSQTEPGAIRIRCWKGDQWLHLAIIDRGAAMPEGALPKGQAPDVTVDVPDLPEGGFGWFMIHTLAQEVQYARIGECNHLNLWLAMDG